MTSKVIALFQVPDNGMQGSARSCFCTVELPRWVGTMEGLRRVVVNGVDGDPQALEAQDPAVDAIVELWFDAADQGGGLMHLPGCVAGYRVTELVEKYEAPQPGDPDRAKLFSFIRPRHEMPRSEFRRHWDEHVPIALRVHAACKQYVRHWVESSHEPDMDMGLTWGIGMISMRDRSAMDLQLFDSPESRAEVIADTAEFVGARRVVLATERCDIAFGKPVRR